MKRIFTSLFSLMAGITFAQTGAVAPDFTVTDMNGQTHTLYSYLNAGKLVVLDVSATWCGPCWDFHGEHFLNEINAEYGASGTNQVVVLFYEGDAATTEADMNGTGGSTQGNWVTGTTYPMINESPIQLNLDVYAPLGFPTINVICPSDKKIKADLFDSWSQGNHTASISAMKAVIDQNITDCAVNGGGGNGGGGNTNFVEENTILKMKLYPNPTKGNMTLMLGEEINGTTIINVYSVNGKLIQNTKAEISEATKTIDVNLEELEAGTYFIQINNGVNTSEMLKAIKN